MSCTSSISISGQYPYDQDRVSSVADVKAYTIGITGSGADWPISSTQDIGPIINNLIADDTTIHIYSGKYVCRTTIDFRNTSRCELKGEGFQRTRIFFNAGTSAINMTNTEGADEDFENSVHDISLYHGAFPGSTTSNSGTYGIRVGRNKTCMFTNVYMRFWETGIYLTNDVFYCNFLNVVADDCTTYAVRISYGTDDRCNSNNFTNCKFKGGTGPGSPYANTATVAAPTYVVYIERGNQNQFTGCYLENWRDRCVYIADDALAQNNQFMGGRMESNGWQGTNNIPIYCGASSIRNYFDNPYFSGNDITSNGGLLENNGSNNWICAPSYLGERCRFERSLLSAGNFYELVRTGSGDATYCLKVADTYSASGNPNTLEIKTARATGNFIHGLDGSDNEMFTIKPTGVMTLGTDDTNDGQLYLYGDSGSNSGKLRIYNGATQDTTNEYAELLMSSADFALRYGSGSVLLRMNSVASTLQLPSYGIDVNAQVKSSIDQQNTTLGDVALEIKQQDVDQGFIDYVGTSAASTANNITTFTTGNTVQGHIRINVNGVDYWMPYYDAPTS